MITEQLQCQKRKIRISFRVGKERGKGDGIKFSTKEGTEVYQKGGKNNRQEVNGDGNQLYA